MSLTAHIHGRNARGSCDECLACRCSIYDGPQEVSLPRSGTATVVYVVTLRWGPLESERRQEGQAGWQVTFITTTVTLAAFTK